MQSEPVTPLWAAGAIALVGLVTYGVLTLLAVVWG
jgi:hypothetical protein